MRETASQLLGFLPAVTALTDRDLLAQPALAAIAAHVQADDPLRAWSLAGELAQVFGKYQAWRRDWLLHWERGADPDDPQDPNWKDYTAEAPPLTDCEEVDFDPSISVEPIRRTLRGPPGSPASSSTSGATT